MSDTTDRVVGCILGTAVGDAFGLPFEGLSKRRIRKLNPNWDRYHFLFGRGMTSDDTEHTCIVAQALLMSGGDAGRFEERLGRELRWWLLGLPAATGFATLRAILKLWIGFPTRSSGVFSAGNGPAMRSAVIGVCYGHDSARLGALVRASTRITHTDPKAEYGARAVAIAAHLASQQGTGPVPSELYVQALADSLPEEAQPLLDLIHSAVKSVGAGETTEMFAVALRLEKGVSGYVYHTVPVAIHAWLKYQTDLHSGVVAVIRCGGDTDSVAAIVGAIVGARVGKAGIPQKLLDGLWEWPRTVQWMEELGSRLASGSPGITPPRALSIPFYQILFRNLFFLAVVLTHGLRRLLPPY